MANLTQLKMLEGLDGVLLVDKPAGLAFSSVVKAVKRRFNLVKVGHGGSLDAMASGLMVLLINEANRNVDAVMMADRTYEGAMRLGLKTNTHDTHGETLAETAAIDWSRRDAALKECRGDIFQTEPRFCSVRREGSAAYEIADTGEHAPFLAHVYRFEVNEAATENEPCVRRFSLLASKGVLVRTLVNDFGEQLGCGAALAALRRLKIGAFDVKNAIPFERLLETPLGSFASLVIPTARAFS